MQIQQVITALETIAPLRYAADWDNVGLLLGSRQWKCDATLLTIDFTRAVLDEAREMKADLIISYHPPLFQPIKKLTGDSPQQLVLLEAIAAGLSVYSPHTALDAAPGGINDWLAESLGSGDVRALEAFQYLPESEECKIVVFCPGEAVDAIRNGLASVGAGQIGRYQLCSFELPGRGTFFAGEGTNPKVGTRGALQHVEEVRLEMVCPRAALGLAIATIRQFHPYEEPAFEVYPLLARPLRHIGQGRRITLDQPVSIKTLTDRIKEHLGLKQVEVAMGDNAPSKYTRIGLCAGAGGSMLKDAIKQECQLYFTGEMRHHDVLEAQARGCTVILAGHTNTERGYLKPYRKRLSELAPGVNIAISKRDSSPLKAM